MSMLDSISKKVMLGYAAILVLLIITAACLYKESSIIYEQKEYFSQQLLPALRDAEATSANLSSLQLAAFALYSTSLSPKDFAEQLAGYEDNLNKNLRALDKLAFAKKLNLSNDKDVIWQRVNRLEQIMRANRVDWDGARDQLTVIEAAVNDFRAKLDDVKKMVEESANKASDNISDEIALMRLLILSSVIAIAFITGLAFQFSRKGIVKPVASLSTQLDSVAAERDLRQDIVIDSSDEIGVAASSVNQLLAEFREGNKDIQKSALEMLGSVEQLNQSAQLSDDQVLTFSSQVKELLNKIDILESSIEISANRSLGASDMAKTGAEQVNVGAENVTKTSHSIGQLAKDVEATAEMLLNLKNAGDKVGSVVKTIAEIAEQTNLLALNAAIEAARAGESGRGFAVVADEVRTLASRTHDSTHEINNILDSIVASITSTVSTMESNKVKANESVTLVKSTVNSLDAIRETVIALSTENTDLASLAQDIKSNASAMRMSVDQIEDASAGVQETSKNTKMASDELSQISVSLNEVVNRFKV